MEQLTGQRIRHATRIVIEHIDRAAVMTTGGQLAIAAQVDGCRETAAAGAAARLIGRDLLSASEIPHVNLAIASGACEVVLVCAESDRPHITTVGLRRHEGPPELEIFAMLGTAPNLDFAAKADAGSHVAESTARGG